MNRTLVAPLAAHDLAASTRASQATGVFRRWLASFAAARERKAATEVLGRLAGHIPRTSGSERTRLEALADDLRRRLR